MVFGGELVLTIGLPLAAGLNLKQFAGVLAHEFGHFSQGAGMRLSALIRTINVWFARMVYERDSWDETLAGWSASEANIQVIALLVRGMVWLTRRVLWVLMMTGHAASGFLLRQMEFDADRYEARMVGGKVFTATARRLQVLNLAARGAYADLASSWAERRLPDNLPKLIMANVAQIPRPALEALREAEAQGRTGIFDTHPCDRERIARACTEASAGIFHLDGPATDLFRDFDAVSCWATYHHYRGLLGPEFTKDQLYPVADAVQSQAVTQEGHEAYGRYFLEALGALQPLPLQAGYPAAPTDLKAARSALGAARDEMVRQRDANRAALERWDDVHGRAVKAAAAVALLKSGNKIKAADFGLDDRTLEAAEAAVARAGADFQKLSATLHQFSAAAARRIEQALALLESDAVAARMPDGPDRREEARALHPCAASLAGRIVQELVPVIWGQHTVVELAQVINRSHTANHPGLSNAILRAGQTLHERLQRLQARISDSLPYPFEHAQENISLRRFALPLIPPKESIGDLVSAAAEAVEKLGTLYTRVLGRLAVTAEEVERALGLPPLTIAQHDEVTTA
jgi:hypothetical protein